MNRLRTIQVAGIGAIALLTVSSGLGCSHTVIIKPNKGSLEMPPPIPATAINAHDPNPGPFGGWGGRTGAEVHEEVPVTPISPTPLEVAIGPKLKVGTWNGWRMPIVNSRGKAAEPSPTEIKETSASTTIPMPTRRKVAQSAAVSSPVATTIPMPKPRTAKPEPAKASDASVLEASQATQIPMPARHFSKPKAETAATPVDAAPVVMEAPASPVVLPEPSEEKPAVAEPTAAEAPAMAEEPVNSFEPAPEPVSMSDPTELPAAPESADPAPNFESADSLPTPTAPVATSEPSLSQAANPVLEVVPASEPATGAAKPATLAADGSELPAVALPEFDGAPLDLAEASRPDAGGVRPNKPSPKKDESMAKVDGDSSQATDPEQKASETTRIPLPVKRGRVSPKSTTPPKPSRVLPASEAPEMSPAPREVDADAFKIQADTTPAIPSRVQ